MHLHHLCIACALGAFIPATGFAAIANFSDGAGNALPDQYPGVAGDGWLDAWTVSNNQGVNTQTISSAAPLATAAAPYLAVTHQNTALTSTGWQLTLRRQFDGPLNGNTTFSWLFRLDGSNGFDGLVNTIPGSAAAATGGEYIGFGNAATAVAGSPDIYTWGVRLLATTPVAGGNAGETVLTWQYNNGAADQLMSTIPAGMLSTGYSASIGDWLGDTFRITVDTRPGASRYDLSIANLTDGTSFGATDLVFDPDAASDLGSYLFMNVRTQVAPASDPLQPSVQFSVDSFSVVVPEPTSFVMLAAPSLMLLRRRRN